jgi:hypothetical protein
MRPVFLTVFLLVLCGPIAYAEVIDLEGTVKAVDVDARTVTIERKTASGSKTLTLEVAKKAGNVADLKPGSPISFSYDPDLEIVTKIGEEDRVVVSGIEGEQGIRVGISMSDTGEASVQVEPIQMTPEGGRIERQDLGDGVWRLTHYFVNPQDTRFFDSPLGKPVNAEVDPSRKTLVFSPRKSQGLENPAANCVYPVRLRVPFEIKIDVSTTAKAGWPFLQVYAMPRDQSMERPVFSFRTRSALESDLIFDVWSSKMGVKEGGTQVVKETRIPLDGQWSKTFRLPIPNIKSQDSYTVTIGSLDPTSDKTFIHRLVVKGFPVPLMGMQLDQNGDIIYVKAVNPGMAAATGGVREGDVILAIDGTKPSSLAKSLELLGNSGFGKACELTVRRGSEDRQIKLRAEWPK